MSRLCLLFGLIAIFQTTVSAQIDFYKHYRFTESDSLRGMLRPERLCYDVTFYELDIKIDPEKRFISGYVDIFYNALEDFETLQIDLYKNMNIRKIVSGQETLAFKRLHHAVFIDFPLTKKGSQGSFRVYYDGRPVTAFNPPWEGGFVWSKDHNGDHWVGVACQGDGASLWWPNKDHLSDEPDSMSIRITVPDPYFCVSNGRLRSKKSLPDDYTRYDWFVSYPINNYNVTVNIAKYVHFSDTYTASDRQILPLNYYVLPKNLEKAKNHFKMVPQMLRCYEYYLGKYPFWEDGYALVETPYLGMEHQSAIAYGNQYMRGYLGTMIPSYMDWDYIIIHETAHEYWGNSISCNDLSEMWIHESFTTYMEALYVECTYGYDEALNYLARFRSRPYILNEEPILGPKDVNWHRWGGSDHYFKGSWVLNTLRHAIGDDALWFDILKSFYTENAMSNINTEQFTEYVKQRTALGFIDSFFEQYLLHPGIPRFEYKLRQKGNDLEIRHRWTNAIKGFNMPLLVGHENDYRKIQPETTWKTTTLENLSAKDFKVATRLFLVDVN